MKIVLTRVKSLDTGVESRAEHGRVESRGGQREGPQDHGLAAGWRALLFGLLGASAALIQLQARLAATEDCLRALWQRWVS